MRSTSIEVPSLYIGCGLTHAPEQFQDDVAKLKEGLKQKYEVFDFVGLTDGTNAEVYRWDIKHCTPGCDLFVAVLDYPSTGLGQELQKRIDIQRPVLGVAHAASLVTRAALGAAEDEAVFTFRRYENMLQDIPGLIEAELGALGIGSC